jgi:hypothetical protein
MTRRTKGPKRNAESYGARHGGYLEGMSGTEIAHGLAAAHMAGYRSASRARKAVNLRVLDHQAEVIRLLKDKVAELEERGRLPRPQTVTQVSTLRSVLPDTSLGKLWPTGL